MHVMQLVQLVLAPLVIAMALMVTLKFRQALQRKPRTPEEFLILGVFVGFLGKFADNCVWSGIWLVQEFDRGWFEVLAQYGSVANVFTRQIPLIVSALCHLHALRLIHRK